MGRVGVAGARAVVNSFRPTIISFDPNLLTNWYAAQQATRTASLLSRTEGPQLSGVSTRDASSARGPTDVTPPWADIDNLPSPDEKIRDALSASQFVDENGANLGTGGPVHPDHKKLFALYRGLDRLQAIAGFAAKDDTPSARLRGLDRQFQDGLTEVLSYIDSFEADDFEIAAGTKRKEADAALTVPRTRSEFTGKVAHRASVLEPMSGLSTSDVFTVSVTKNGATQDITMSMADVGEPLTLDAVVGYMNQRLEDEGVVSRFSRERIIEREDEDDEGEFSLPPNTFGIKIEGVSTERLSFSAPDATATVQVAGVSGTGNREAGQILEFTGVDGGAPTLRGGPRLEPEEQGDEDTDTSVQVRASVQDSNGNLYVTGTTRVDLGQGAPLGETDAFVSKYDSTGTLVWTRSLGASQDASGLAIALDSDENVVIAGEVAGEAVVGARGGGTDGFVSKLDSGGQTLWTRQVSPAADDGAIGLSAGANGAVYVTGYANAALSSTSGYAGGEDATLIKLDGQGATVYEHQFGGAGDDRAVKTALAQDGNLVVASIESGRAIVRKLNESDPGQPPLWEVDLGDLNKGQIGDLKMDGDRIYLAGTTRAAGLTANGDGAELGTFSGGRDGFLTRIDDLGGTADVTYTRYIGSNASDNINSLTIHNGDVILAGDTLGDMDGTGNSGTRDGFIARYSAGGDEVWTQQYGGRSGFASAQSVTVDPTGSSVLDVLGLPRGDITYGGPRTVTANGPVRAGQSFSIAVDGGRPKKITIEADDTLRALSRKIENVLLLNGEARVRRTSEGDKLRIEGKEGVKIELIAGDGADDALKGLGLEAGLVVNEGSLLDNDDEAVDTANDGPLFFGLGLERDLKIDNRTGASRASQVLLDSLSAVRKAFNDLTRDPALDALLRESNRVSGPVPADLQRQIANYQAGLDRLLGGGPTTGGFF